jgi:hypothetical protein
MSNQVNTTLQDVGSFFGSLFDKATGAFSEYLNYRLIRSDQELNSAYANAVNSYHQSTQPSGSGTWSNPTSQTTMFLVVGSVVAVGAVLLLRRR